MGGTSECEWSLGGCSFFPLQLIILVIYSGLFFNRQTQTDFKISHYLVDFFLFSLGLREEQVMKGVIHFEGSILFSFFPLLEKGPCKVFGWH